MKWRWSVGLLLALSAVIVLVAFFPAFWAWQLVRGRVPSLQLESVHGSVWNGYAERIAYAGMPLGAVQWQLARSTIFAIPRLHVRMDGTLLRGDGCVRWQGGALIGNRLHFVVHADHLPLFPSSPVLQPRGEVIIDIAHVRMRNYWPQQLDGEVIWRRAAFADRHGPIALGDLHARLHERAGTTLSARFSDAGGPLALSGSGQASLLGWRLDARLQARTDAVRLRQLLAHLGPLNNNDTLYLRRYGGMVMGARP